MRNSNKNKSRRPDDRKPEADVIRPGDDDGIELASFAPPVSDEDDDVLIYQNFSNGYGRKVRNYSNNYGDPDGEPVKQPPAVRAPSPPTIRTSTRKRPAAAPPPAANTGTTAPTGSR